ncbi:tryptophan synthase subunit alpha [Pontibacillus yanchengensis]|uniref:Tryptophan synthase alpha chain n=1 Tax=Pontibacillus yanchengensis Y32 TaxID=1385514 RepID=A0A0A2TGW2_9BACI|nr:tryptophan synthase subunit alpha [Pontibacillus yanchengensis]KGP73693.1 tryptophan synthase subunit alpha [Pontibacillus yanchengensis Y32]
MTNHTVTSTFAQRLPKTENMFIPFIMSGDPTPELTIELAYTLQESGADVLELGVPYSDPLADGPTIQQAAARAIEQGMTIQKAIQLIPEMRKRGVHIPIVLFTYCNPVLQYGMETLVKELKKNEADGLLVPDIPLEESEELKQHAEAHGIQLISLVAPNSEERIKRIAEQASGFLYCVSSLGVTGERAEMDPNISSFLEKVKHYSSVPVAVGFGISTNDQVQLMHNYSDGVIVGSKIIKIIEGEQSALLKEDTRDEGLKRVKEQITQLINY